MNASPSLRHNRTVDPAYPRSSTPPPAYSRHASAPEATHNRASGPRGALGKLFSMTGSFPLPNAAAFDGSDAQKRNMVRGYAWLTASLGVTGASACAAAACLPPFGLVGSLAIFGAQLGLLVATCQSRNGGQQIACNLAFNAALGVGLGGLVSVVGTPVLAAAGAYTAGVVGSMMAASLTFPAGSFRNWDGPLYSALIGLIVCGAITSLMPAAWTATATLSTIECVLGLGLFSAYIVRDTSRMAQMAQQPEHMFNPIEASMPVYLDVMNVFVRVVELLIRDQERRR